MGRAFGIIGALVPVVVVGDTHAVVGKEQKRLI
jgi:hypothetical protein